MFLDANNHSLREEKGNIYSSGTGNKKDKVTYVYPTKRKIDLILFAFHSVKCI